MSTAELLARRLSNQQLAAPRTADPAEVTRQLGAVQSQEYAQSLWALGLRTQGASAASVEAALRAVAKLAYEVPPRILITGSLYLAGHVLAANGTVPS